MKYALLIYAAEKDWQAKSKEEQTRVYNEYWAYSTELKNSGKAYPVRRARGSPPPPGARRLIASGTFASSTPRGASSNWGPLVRTDLVDEALRLARSLSTLLPHEPEAMGLLGLMLLHDSRRTARVDDHGDLVLLADQDRTKWNRAQIEEGSRLVEAALRRLRPGPYQIQGAIAAVHAEATAAAETDWAQVAVLYDQLLRYEQTPVVELNRAVAVSFARGPSEGLAQLAAIEGRGALRDYAPFHIARADMLRRLGRQAEADASYRAALTCAPNDLVRRFLRRQLREASS